MVEQQAVGEYLYRTFRTTVNVIDWLRLREGNVKPDDPRYAELARDELGNARGALKVYAAALWLNHKLRIDFGMNDRVTLVEEKIRMIVGYLAGK